MRTVYDGWASYHARIEEKTSRYFDGRKLYRYRIIRHFATDDVYKTGFWIGNRDTVIARANSSLDQIEARDPGRGEAL